MAGESFFEIIEAAGMHLHVCEDCAHVYACSGADRDSLIGRCEPCRRQGIERTVRLHRHAPAATGPES